MPWRPGLGRAEQVDSYEVLVSEFMLQQTQVSRVIPKYTSFMKRFPSLRALAGAARADVISEWVGLGYNRRAAYLHEASKQLAGQTEPYSLSALTACKGIGHNTAAAIIVYSYNQPQIFIETNIRTVIGHYFFADEQDVNDGQILDIMAKVIDRDNPRGWYYAMMDLGAELKSSRSTPMSRFRSFNKQSTFEGSQRQLRAHALRLLTDGPSPEDQILKALEFDGRTKAALESMQKDGLVRHDADLNQWRLAD